MTKEEQEQKAESRRRRARELYHTRYSKKAQREELADYICKKFFSQLFRFE